MSRLEQNSRQDDGLSHGFRGVRRVPARLANYFLKRDEEVSYKCPSEYDAIVLAPGYRRDNLARGVADVVERNLQGAGGKILELGAGTGILTRELATRGLNVTALDLSGVFLEGLKEKVKEEDFSSNVNVINADMNRNLPFKDDSFDLVVSLRATRYIENFDFFMQEVSRVTGSGGSFILPVFFIDKIPWKRHSRNGFSQVTSFKGLAHKVEASGFDINWNSSGNYNNLIDNSSGKKDVPFYYRPSFIVATKN